MPSSYLSIDYGHVKMGVAIGQDVTRTAQPLAVIKTDLMWTELEKLIKKYRPKELIVGLPLNMDGSENSVTSKARTFALEAENRYGLNVHLIDERLTTKEAHWFLEERGLPKDTPNDAIAAALILESFLRESKPK